MLSCSTHKDASAANDCESLGFVEASQVEEILCDVGMASLPVQPAKGNQVSTLKRKPVPYSVMAFARSDSNDASDPQEPETSIKVIKETSSPKHDLSAWQPVWLRTSVLVLFFGLFTSMWIALLILWRVSDNQNGLQLTISDNPYAWTYGPTAILVVVVGLWRQVDYHCKVVTPWLEIQKGNSPCDRSMLCDYQWPISTTSLWAAMRNRHGTVAASILGFVLLKGIVIFSTGLLVLLPTPLPTVVPITLSTSFDNGTLWQEVDPEPYISTVGTTYIVPSVPYEALLGSINEIVPKGFGIIENGITLPTFTLHSTAENLTTVSFQIDAFVPNITCESADVLHWELQSHYSETKILLDVDSPTCHARHMSPVGPPGSTYNQSLHFRIDDTSAGNSSYQIVNIFSRLNCSQYQNSDGPDYGTTLVPLTASTPNYYSYTFVVLNVSQNGTIIVNNEDYTNQPRPNYSLLTSTAITCSLGYYMAKANVNYTVDTAKIVVNSVDYPLQSALTDLSNLQLSELMYSSLSGADSSDSVFDVLVDALHSFDAKAAKDALFRPGILKSVVKIVCTELANIYISLYHMENTVPTTSSTVSGSAKYNEARLHVGMLSLWTMVILLIALSILTAILALRMRHTSLPLDVRSAASHAVVLASSPSLKTLLSSTENHDAIQYPSRLKSFAFSSNTSGDFVIEHASVTSAVVSAKEKQKSTKEWTPYIGRRHAMILTIFLPLVAMIVLEVLSRYSLHNGGLMDVNAATSPAVYAIKYGSILVMLLVATLYSALDFTVAAFTPITSMRKESRNARDGLLLPLLGLLPSIALCRSLRARYFGALCSNLAAILGSFLTIIVSGLWIVQHPTYSDIPVPFSLNSSWTTRWNDSVDHDNNATALFNGIQHGIFSLPLHIWNDLVFPNISYLSEFTEISSAANLESNYTIMVPAIRPKLDCDVLATDELAVSRSLDYSYVGSPAPEIKIAANLTLPAGCRGGPLGNQTVIEWVWTNAEDKATNGFYARFDDLLVTPWYDTYGNASYVNGQQNVQSPPQNPAGCPSVSIVVANWTGGIPDSEKCAVLICHQRLQKVPTTINLIGSPTSMQISSLPPPFLDEDNAVYITNGTANVTSFEYRLWPIFQVFEPFERGFLPYGHDYFFDQLIYGPNGTNISTLVSTDGTVNTTNLYEAADRLYRKFMTLVIERDLKVPRGSSQDQVEDEAYGFMTITTYPVTISAASKLTLQIILATMMLLGTITYATVPLRGTLPYPPTSIANVMSLFAGSEMCDPKAGIIVPGATRMTNKQLEKMFDGWKFSLGWWEKGDQEEKLKPTTKPGSKPSISVDELGSGEGSASSIYQHESTQQSTLMSKDARASVTSIDSRANKRFGIDVGNADSSGFRRRGRESSIESTGGKWWSRVGQNNNKIRRRKQALSDFAEYSEVARHEEGGRDD